MTDGDAMEALHLLSTQDTIDLTTAVGQVEETVAPYSMPAACSIVPIYVGNGLYTRIEIYTSKTSRMDGIYIRRHRH